MIEREFRLEDVNHSPAFFDVKKLAAFNGEYIRMLSVDDFIAACQPFLHWPPTCRGRRERFDAAKFAAMAPVVQSRASTLAEVPGVIDFLFLADPVLDQEAWAKTMAAPRRTEVLAEVTEAYRQLPQWDAAALKDTLEAIGRAARSEEGQGASTDPRCHHRSHRRPALVRGARGVGAGGSPPTADHGCEGVSNLDPLVADTPAHGTPTVEVPAVEVVTDPTPVGGITDRRPRNAAADWSWGSPRSCCWRSGTTRSPSYQVHSTGRSDQARPVDAIVVMGAAQYDGRPSPQLAARLDHAVDLWRRASPRFVVVTGGNQPGDRFTEAEASANYLIDRGVPAEAILQETVGHSSYASLDGVADLLQQRGLFRVLLVSDPFHSLRSRLIAQELGLVAYVSPTRTSPVRGKAACRRSSKRRRESRSDGSSGSSGCCRSPGECRV